MIFTAHTRRTFLAASAGTVASLVVTTCPQAVEADARPAPTGSVHGRVGRKGIPPGTAAAPSQGEVVLLDGRVLMASHVTSQGIKPGSSVLLSPHEIGRWSILYAEF